MGMKYSIPSLQKSEEQSVRMLRRSSTVLAAWDAAISSPIEGGSFYPVQNGKHVFWSVPRVGTEKSALKLMVNLGKCHCFIGRKSPKRKPKYTAKCFCVCLTSIWVIALASQELVLNRSGQLH